MMERNKKRVTVLLCSVALVAMSSAAIARPAHKAAHRHVSQVGDVPTYDADFSAQTSARAQLKIQAHPERKKRTTARRTRARDRVAAEQPTASSFGGFGGGSLVAEARKYLGTNPTGRGSLWCGAFMDMVLKRTGHEGGGNLASAYARYGTRVSGPQVGAIAVMGRKGGGHVGVVSGIDPNGNPIIVSGNHNRTVAESVYPRGRIYAYVMP